MARLVGFVCAAASGALASPLRFAHFDEIAPREARDRDNGNEGKRNGAIAASSAASRLKGDGSRWRHPCAGNEKARESPEKTHVFLSWHPRSCTRWGSWRVPRAACGCMRRREDVTVDESFSRMLLTVRKAVIRFRPADNACPKGLSQINTSNGKRESNSAEHIAMADKKRFPLGKGCPANTKTPALGIGAGVSVSEPLRIRAATEAAALVAVGQLATGHAVPTNH